MMAVASFLAASAVMWEVSAYLNSLRIDRSLLVHLPALAAAVLLGLTFSVPQKSPMIWVLVGTAVVLYAVGRVWQKRVAKKLDE